MITQSDIMQSTTQKYLELFDISNDVLILQDGAVSMVMESSAINFDLYSEEEQDAAIYAYAALLNSLSFSIEIVIRSQKKDVTSYLDLLKNAEIKAYNPMNKKNIREYREFVAQLVQERNVLEKKFYIIITYSALEAGLLPGTSLIPGMQKKNQAPLDKAAILEKAITNLQPRREHLQHQFSRIGLFLRQVKTQELIQLFYTIYNPDGAKGIRVGESAEYATPLVESSLPPQELIESHAPPPQPKADQQPIEVTPEPVLASAPPPQLSVVEQATTPVTAIKEESLSIAPGTDLTPPTPPDLANSQQPTAESNP